MHMHVSCCKHPPRMLLLTDKLWDTVTRRDMQRTALCSIYSVPPVFMQAATACPETRLDQQQLTKETSTTPCLLTGWGMVKHAYLCVVQPLLGLCSDSLSCGLDFEQVTMFSLGNAGFICMTSINRVRQAATCRKKNRLVDCIASKRA